MGNFFFFNGLIRFELERVEQTLMMSILVFEFFTNYLRMDLWILVNYLTI